MTSTGWGSQRRRHASRPALHYSGFLMTEPLTLTVVAAALWRCPRRRGADDVALRRVRRLGDSGRSGSPPGARPLAGLPVCGRSRCARGARPCAAPSTRATRRCAAASWRWFSAIVVARHGELSAESILGAYTPIGEEHRGRRGRLVAMAWHALDVAILGLAIPVLAIAVLAYVVFARRDTDPALRAFVAVALAYVSLLVVQVGLFSAEYVGHVAERYLITALPCSRSGSAPGSRAARRAPYAVVVPVWALLVAGAATIPLAEIAAPETLVNTFTPSSLVDLSVDQARAALVAAAVVAGALFVAVPRRLAWTRCGRRRCRAGTRLGGQRAARRRRVRARGPRVDGLCPRRVARRRRSRRCHPPRTGDRLWTSTARTVFWNRAIAEVLRVAPATLPFPPVTPAVEVGDDGVVRTADGGTLERQVVVAPSTVVLAGEKVAERGATTARRTA